MTSSIFQAPTWGFSLLRRSAVLVSWCLKQGVLPLKTLSSIPVEFLSYLCLGSGHNNSDRLSPHRCLHPEGAWYPRNGQCSVA